MYILGVLKNCFIMSVFIYRIVATGHAWHIKYTANSNKVDINNSQMANVQFT